MTGDRLERLLAQSALTGIDFVFVHADQVRLDVHFHVDPAGLAAPLVNDLAADRVLIRPRGGDAASTLPVTSLAWVAAPRGQALRVTLPFPGGFSPYTLEIADPRLDPYYRRVEFSFKAACPSDLDCRTPGPPCPAEAEVDFPVDYAARDFWSLRRALLDFAAQRYPDWSDRLEADVGVMLAELMSAVGDELAYYQDRVGREAHLETAAERRSLRLHARLVDHEIHDGRAAGAWLDLSVRPSQAGAVPAGAHVWGRSEQGDQIDFETGRGQLDAGASFAVDARWNRFVPHVWDADDTCLPAGATSLFVAGDHQASIVLDDTPPGRAPGRWMLLRTDPDRADRPARRWPVRVVSVRSLFDPLTEGGPTAITELAWEEEQKLPWEIDLEVLEVRGNLVPATHGRARTARFVAGRDPGAPELGLPPEARAELERALERHGANGSVVYRFTLPETAEKALTRLGAEPRAARPEVVLFEEEWDGAGWQAVRPWEWRRSLLGTASSDPTDAHFTLEDGTWRRVVGFQRGGGEVVHRDYADDRGASIRFGDGEFGTTPARGTIFRASYRVGNGRPGNVAADSLNAFDAAQLPFVEAVTNPLPAGGGVDPETPQAVRSLAPEAFREITFRAVRPEDYAAAAEELDEVQRAGAAFRWTGSWLTAFVTPDPAGATHLGEGARLAIERKIERYRQAGRPALVSTPRYADLDLSVTVCVAAGAYAGQVKTRVLAALVPSAPRAADAFFAPDNFTFGTPLRRSRLEAAIQRVDGVRAVKEVRVRRRGFFDWRPLTGPYLPIDDREVIRLDNDPDHPDRGTLTLVMEGGA